MPDPCDPLPPLGATGCDVARAGCDHTAFHVRYGALPPMTAYVEAHLWAMHNRLSLVESILRPPPEQG